MAVFGTIAGAEGRSGLISFIPENEGPATRVKVTNGEYVFDESNGPQPGQHRVVLQLECPPVESSGAVRMKGIMVSPDQAARLSETIEVSYERRSLDIDVPDEGSLQLNLKLPEAVPVSPLL